MVSDDKTAFLKGYYDDFSRTYDAPRASGYHKWVDDFEFSIVAPYATGKRVLEVGCGTGLLLEKATSVACEAVGVDLSEGMLNAARSRGLKVSVASATSLPFDDGSFDVTYSFKVLAHVQDIRRAIAEMVRVTARGGVVVAEFYNPHSLRYVARKIAEGTGGRSIGLAHNENAVPTRWDTPTQAREYFLGMARVIDVVGVRVVTPFAQVFRVPGVARVARWAEESAAHPWAQFGGFFVVVARVD